jgi:hypothetical protein
MGERAWKHFPQWLRFVKAEGSSNSDANMVCRQSKKSGDQLLIERATANAAIPDKEITGDCQSVGRDIQASIRISATMKGGKNTQSPRYWPNNRHDRTGLAKTS